MTNGPGTTAVSFSDSLGVFPVQLLAQPDNHLGWVVRKPINSNPGLKVYPGLTGFLLFKSVFIAFVLWTLRFVNVKTVRQNSLKSSKSKMKIYSYSGLA